MNNHLLIEEVTRPSCCDKITKQLKFTKRIWFVIVWRSITFALLIYQIYRTVLYIGLYQELVRYDDELFSFKGVCDCTKDYWGTDFFLNGTNYDITKYNGKHHIIYPFITFFKCADLFGILVADYFIFREIIQQSPLSFSTFCVSKKKNQFPVQLVWTSIWASVIIIMSIAIPQYITMSAKYGPKYGTSWFYECRLNYIPLEENFNNCNTSCQYHVATIERNGAYNDIDIYCTNVIEISEHGYFTYTNLIQLNKELYKLSLAYTITSIGGLVIHIYNFILFYCSKL